MSVPLTTKPAAVSREMKNPFRFALGALRWTLALPQFVLPFVRTNKIRKFLGYAVAVCIGCIVVSALLVFPSLVGEGGALVGGANRRMPSMPSFLVNETTTVRQQVVLQRFQLDRQRRRRQRVLDVCERLNASNQLLSENKTVTPSHFRAIFVDDARRLLYCEVPKVACTNWKRILLILTGRMNTTQPEALGSNDVHGRLEKTYLRRLDSFNINEIQHRLDTYYKFLFVREPFERILSAYHNKFTSRYNDMFKRVFGRKIVKNYRLNPTNESLHGGHDVTFEEFVAYLLDPKTTKRRPFNAHWRQYYDLCQPCLVHYDLIGKYETLNDDADLALTQIGVRRALAFPTANPRRVRTSDLLAHKFANISAANIHQLWRLYSNDFSLFGYTRPRFGVDPTIASRT